MIKKVLSGLAGLAAVFTALQGELFLAFFTGLAAYAMWPSVWQNLVDQNIERGVFSEGGNHNLVYASFVFIAIALPGSMYFGDDEDGKGSSSSMTATAHILCREGVKAKLVSPTSAEFPLSANIDEVADGVYSVGSYVDASNSFGASIRKNWVCEAKFMGGNYNDPANWTLTAVEIY